MQILNLGAVGRKSGNKDIDELMRGALSRIGKARTNDDVLTLVIRDHAHTVNLPRSRQTQLKRRKAIIAHAYEALGEATRPRSAMRHPTRR